MMTLRDRLRSGDIWVEGSRAFRAFDDFLLPLETFAARRQENELGLAVSNIFDDWRTERVGLLEIRLREIDALAAAGKLTEAATMHGRLDLPGYPALFLEFPEAALVSVSDDQRKPLPARWIATVPHGLPPDLYTFSPHGAGGYLAFLGRISPEKRLDRAIEIAERAGATLKIAAKVDKVDAAYFEAVIRPLLHKPGIEYVGEICDREKQAFLSGAMALLFPIDWPEPFGIVQIEAMACGTPVIAWRRGSVPEVIDHGVTGFIVDRIEEAVTAVDKVSSLSRKAVRRGFERRFSIERVARDYIRVYEFL